MLNRLPLELDLSLVNRGLVLSGQVPTEAMLRLRELGVGCAPEVAVSLSLSVERKGLRVVRGSAQATLTVPCNRCLEPVAWPVDTRFCLALVANDEEASDDWPSDMEPYVVEGERLVLAGLIEDEIILALPALVAHEDAQACTLYQQYRQESNVDPADEGSKPNPFAVLSTLKQLN
jgi:uncharacterized protein